MLEEHPAGEMRLIAVINLDGGSFSYLKSNFEQRQRWTLSMTWTHGILIGSSRLAMKASTQLD